MFEIDPIKWNLERVLEHLDAVGKLVDEKVLDVKSKREMRRLKQVKWTLRVAKSALSAIFPERGKTNGHSET